MITPPNILTRALAGTNATVKNPAGALTWNELDKNLIDILGYAVAIAQAIDVALKENGTLKDGTAGTTAIVNRAITKAKLSLVGLPFFADAGGPNAYVIAPDPVATEYADGMIFYILAANANTGPSTLKVNGLAVTSILKRGNAELEAGDIPKSGVFAVCYAGEKFHLISSAATSAGGTTVTVQDSTFVGLQKYEAELDVPANTETATFSHGLPAVPDLVDLRLICVVEAGDNGIAYQTELPLSQVTDANGKPAFSVAISYASIAVKCISATLYDSAATLLTAASWKLRCEAGVTSNTTTRVFPALTYHVVNPQCAFGYGSDVIFWHKAPSANKTYGERLSLQTNILSPLTLPSESMEYANVSLFRRTVSAALEDHAIYTTDSGIFVLPLKTPWEATETYAVNNRAQWKPAWIVDPDISEIYLLPSDRGDSGTHKISALQVIRVASGVNENYVVLNLASNAIKSADGTAGNVEMLRWYTGNGGNARCVLCQYNPIAGRLYVMTDEVGLLHVFQLLGANAKNFKLWLDEGAGRYDNLKYLRTIGIPGDGAARSTGSNDDHICVEWDMSTGVERSIVFTRRGTVDRGGSVTRVPWVG